MGKRRFVHCYHNNAINGEIGEELWQFLKKA